MDFSNTQVIGMIHVPALPGTPNNRMTVPAICRHCLEEAAIYLDNGVDTLMIENMHDVPYLKGEVGPEITAAMAVVGREVKKLAGERDVGIQILAAANKEALAAAHAADLDFIRVEGFVFGHVADEGIIQSCAGELLRYRKQIGAEDVLIFTDIKKKHSSHSITADVDIAEAAEAAGFFLSDGLIVTGTHTGKEPGINDVKKVKKVTNLPLLLGSGINPTNLKSFLPYVDGFIVGSYFKENNDWRAPLVPEKIKAFMKEVERL